MLTRVLIALAIASSSVVILPEAAKTDEYETCMLRNGCFLPILDNEAVWTCSDVNAYADCVG